MVNVAGYEHNNFRGTDAIISNLFCQKLQACIERIYLIHKSAQSITRSLSILSGVRNVICESNHARLMHQMNNSVASIFGFEKCAILFKQCTGPNLYNIYTDDIEELA